MASTAASEDADANNTSAAESIDASTESNDDTAPQQQVRSLLMILAALPLNNQVDGSGQTAASSNGTPPISTLPPPPMSHYRHVPASVKNAYETMRQAATNIKATSLKYALLRGAAVKLGQTATSNATAKKQKSQDDALRVAGASFVPDCHLLVEACTTLWDDAGGCAPSTKAQARRIAQSILTTVAQQLECDPFDPNYGPRAGAVDEMCRTVTEKQMAVGNRVALRRDLLTYVMECRSTGTEFQQVIDHTANSSSDKASDSTIVDGNDQDTNDDWGNENDDETYSTLEMPIAKACVAILLCSRWSLNASMAAMDAVGDVAAEPSATVGDDTTGIVPYDRWCWMGRLHQLATATGIGVTDLGVSLYPPMDVVAVQAEVERQTLAVQETVDHILTYAAAAANNNAHDVAEPAVSSTGCAAVAWNLPLEVTDVAQNVQKAIATRKQQALDAIGAAVAAADVPLSAQPAA